MSPKKCSTTCWANNDQAAHAPRSYLSHKGFTTMKAFALLSCALVCWSLVLGSSAVAADDKVDVTGVWNVEIEIGGQTGMPVFTLKQDGEKITGKYKGQFVEPVRSEVHTYE